MEAEPVVTWSNEPETEAAVPESPRARTRTRVRPATAGTPGNKGPALLVAGFAAVLLAVLIWPPRANKPSVSSTSTVSTEQSPLDPLAVDGPEAGSPVVVPSETPTAAVSPTPSAPSPLPRTVASPAVVAEASPRALLPDLFAAGATPTPSVEKTPSAPPRKEKPASPAVTPSPTPKIASTPAEVAVTTPTPKLPPVVKEEPPAKATDTYYSVRVYVTPNNVDSKVYLVNSGQRYMDQGRGNIRLQPDKKGTYTLKVIAAGYETFSKEVKVEGEHNLAVRLEKIPPPPEPVYQPPAPSGGYDPGPAPAPYYPPPPPPPSGGGYQIQAPGI